MFGLGWKGIMMRGGWMTYDGCGGWMFGWLKRMMGNGKATIVR